MNQESRIQKQLVDWWQLACHGYRLDARLLYHVPNGGKRSRIEAAIFKGLGVRAGIPDLVLAVPAHGKPGLYIEMKSPDGRVTSEQKELLPLLEQQGYAVTIAWSFDEGVAAIINYLRCGDPLRKL